MKKYLFVMRRMPNRGNHVQEALDMILTAAAFDQKVSLLFADDGVLQLKRGQLPETMGLKDSPAIFKALEIYDVHDLYAESESLVARGLAAEDLILPVRVIARQDVASLLQAHDVLIPD